MFILVVSVLALIVSSIVCVGSASQYEADSYYQSAIVYYNSNDYKNALRNIHLARDIYSELGDTYGLANCDSILSQIDDLLPDSQMAAYYYDIGGDYFLEDQTVLENMEYAKDFAEYAKQYYLLAEDSNGVLRAEDLINRVNQEIQSIRNSRILEANDYYLKAQSAFFDDDYIMAREYAQNASTIYSSIPYPDGISKTSILLASIESKIDSTRQNAQASYNKALDYYVENNFDYALQYAQKAKGFYSMIQDSAGLSKTMTLITKINSEVQQTTEGRKREAEDCKRKAEEYLIAQNYANASEYAKKARDIYSELYAVAYANESLLPEGERYNTKLYSSLLEEVNTLIERIHGEWGVDNMNEQAELYYRRAQEYLIKNQYTEALSYSRKSKELFESLNNIVGLSKADSLVKEVESKISQRQNADSLYTQSLEEYSEANFEDARLHAAQAKNIYDNLWLTNQSSDCTTLLEDIAVGAQKRSDANNYHASAVNYYSTGDYGKAKENAEKAYKLYVEINYKLGIDESGKILADASERVDAEYRQFRNMVIVVAVVLLIGGFLIFTQMRKKKEEVQELEQARIDEEERRRRDREAWEIEKESETKERVEDELRALIEKEREQGG